MGWIIIPLLIFIIGLIAGVKGNNHHDDGNINNTMCRCPNCGAPLKPGAHQCGWCGDCW